jgi:hypothetical protein
MLATLIVYAKLFATALIQRYAATNFLPGKSHFLLATIIIVAKNLVMLDTLIVVDKH